MSLPARVCQVIRRHIHSLYRCDGSFSRRSDSLLKCTHLCSKSWLVTYCRRHTSEQGRHFRTRLCKPEDVINKQQYILIFHITKILCHRKTGQTHTHTCSRWFIHLSVHQCCFINNTAFFHLIIKIISFSCPLSYTGKYGKSSVSGCYVVNQFHDQNRLSYPGTTEQTDLSTFRIRTDQIHNFNSGFQNLCCRNLLFVFRCISVDRPLFLCDYRT